MKSQIFKIHLTAHYRNGQEQTFTLFGPAESVPDALTRCLAEADKTLKGGVIIAATIEHLPGTPFGIDKEQ